MSTAAGQGSIPGALYDGDGTLLAGEGPEMTSALTDVLPCKALVRDRPERERVAVLEHSDRLWLLPDSFGTPPELPRCRSCSSWLRWSAAGARWA